MKLLFCGDWHLDLANLAYTVPAIEAGFAAAAGRYDSLLHAGDLVIHNSSVHPDVAYRVRELLLGAADKAPGGSIVLAGNHDQSFHADRVGMVEGIFGNDERHERLWLASQPDFHILGDSVAVVCVPTPNKYWARARAEEGADITELLAAAVRGMIAQARERVHGSAGRVVVLYHGTIGGATLGDERQMPSGVDLTLPREAFAGSDIVLAGHIHHRQEIPGTAIAPPILYCGAPAPLTWNDRKLEPGMWLVDVSAAGVTWDLIPLPVISQLLQIDLPAEPEADVNAAIREVVTARAGAGDRVRVCVQALQAVLDTISTDQRRALEADLGLQSLKVTGKRTDTATARMQIDVSASVVDALRQWSALKEIDGPTFEKLLALANEVEAAAADDHIDARYELDPLSLRVENWCQYGDALLDFAALNGLVVIEGANYSGKSNIMRAVAWALYKLQMSGNRLDDLIRKGTDWMRVTFEFRSGGRHYRIIREAKRTARGASAALHLQEVLPDGSALPLAEGNARETQATIEKLVGPADLFLATSFAGQNEVDALLDLTPGEMKDLLMQILQRDFGARHTAGRTEWNAAKTTEAAALASAKAIRGSLPLVDEGAMPTLRATLTEHEGDVVARRQAVTDRMQELAEARAALGTVEAAEGEAAAAAAAVDEWRKRGVARAETMAKTKAQLAAVEARLRDVPAAPAPTSAELRASRQAAAAAASEAEAALVAVADAALARTAPLDAHRQTCRDEQQAALGNRALVASRLAQARTDAGLIDGVPCQGEVVQFVDYATRADESADCSKCQFLTRAAAARDQIGALEQALVDADARIAAAGVAYDAALTAADDARRVAVAARQAVEVHRHNSNSVDRAAAEAAHAAFTAEQAIVAAEADRVRVGELERAIFEHEALAAEVQAEIDRLAVKAASFGDRLKHAETVRQAEHVAATRLAEEEGQLATLERMVTTTRGSIASIEAAVEQAKAGETKAAAWDETAATAAERATVCALYADAMHRDGIPFLLLEQYSIPMLQTVTNEYLDGTNISVHVESDRELQSGELRNAVAITFGDHRGRHPVSAASGAQRFSTGSSLRHGMAELLARGTGSNIWLAVQDEGFGTLDPDNLEIAKTTLRNIAARRGRFIVISHVPGMSDVADHVLRVVDDGGTSRIEVL